MKYFGEFTLKYNFDLKYNLTVISTVAPSEERVILINLLIKGQLTLNVL